MRSVLGRCRPTPALLAACLIVSGAAAADYSLYFGGPGGSVRIETPEFLNGAEHLTVECWFRTPVVLRQRAMLVSQWAEQSKEKDKGRFYLSVGPYNRVTFGIRNEKGAFRTAFAMGRLRGGGWRHVAGTWDGAEIRVYLDGRELGKTSAADFGALGSSRLALTIGPLEPAKRKKPTVFDGFISDVSIWKEARAAEAIKQDMKTAPKGAEPGLVACYPLREPTPTSTVGNRAAGRAAGRLTGGLARVGWCKVPTPYDPDAGKQALTLFSYDLSAPAKGDAAVDINGGWKHQLVTNEKEQRIGVIWQDKRTKAVYVTWVDRSYDHHRTIKLEAPADALLAAGATDPAGNIYYLTVQDAPRNRSEKTTLVGTLHKAAADGKPVGQKPVDCGRSAFNIWAFDRRWGASMRYSKGALGLIITRTMYKSADGLNHQAAIAATFSARDLSLVKIVGTTSSHSMGHSLGVGSRGEFIGVDLGDNYPRGVHLHKFTIGGKASRVVFTYKTRHGTSPRGGSPKYDEISGGDTTFYKWSNDNATYTELGGVVEGRQTYSVIFATDQSPEGKVLDNSRAFGRCTDPRNLAMLRVIKKFERAPNTGSEVSDAIMAGIPRGSRTETGGFYTFGGKWSKQRVTGVIWLTQYKPNEGAHAPQVTSMKDGSRLIIWEKSEGKRRSIWTMRVTEAGKIVGEPRELDYVFRLNRNDRVARVGSSIYFLAREETRKRLRLYFIRD